MSVKLVRKENFSENMFINLERPDEDKLLQKYANKFIWTIVNLKNHKC